MIRICGGNWLKVELIIAVKFGVPVLAFWALLWGYCKIQIWHSVFSTQTWSILICFNFHLLLFRYGHAKPFVEWSVPWGHFAFAELSFQLWLSICHDLGSRSKEKRFQSQRWILYLGKCKKIFLKSAFFRYYIYWVYSIFVNLFFSDKNNCRPFILF